MNETHEWEDPQRGRALNDTVKLKLQQMQELSGKFHLDCK